MKLFVVVCAALAVAIVLETQLGAQQRDFDSGPIQAIDGDRVYVTGERGGHVLETVGVCYWCEVGLHVLINFQSVSRATIQPFFNTMGRRPVPVYIIRDGRED